MERKKTLVLLGILIVFLLSIGIGFVRFSNRALVASKTAGNVHTATSFSSIKTSTRANKDKQLARWKEQEILGIAPELSSPANSSQAAPYTHPSRPNERWPGSAFTEEDPLSVVERPYTPSKNVYEAADRSMPGVVYQPTAGNRISTPQAGRYAGGGANYNSSSIAGSSSMTGEENTQRMMAPFLRGLTKEQAEALNRSLDGLSSRVERAILQAMLPKSKKDANIEKYLQRNRAEGGDSSSDAAVSTAAGPFAEVLKQVSSQKGSVVKSMGNAYGSKAAKEAGRIMDSYQKELASALEKSEGKTPEALANQARAISKKYNDQLNKVSDKYGLEKFREENLAKDQAYLADVERTYGSELAAQMRKLREGALEQKMQLAQETGLTTEEAYEKHLEIERNLWQQEQDLLISQGFSPTELYKIKNKAREENSQEENKIPTVYRMSEKQQDSYSKSVGQMNRQMQQNDVSSYGERGAETLKPIYDWYTNEVQKIIADQETSQEEKDRALQNASQRANQELARLKGTPEMRQMRVETSLNNIMQDPALKRATPEQREAFRKTAGQVLGEMFDKADEIERSNLSEPEKRRQLQALQDEAQRRLSGGQ